MSRPRKHRKVKLINIDNDLWEILQELNTSDLVNKLLRKHFDLTPLEEWEYSDDEELYLRMQNVKAKIRWALVNNRHSDEAVYYLGCDIATARAHIEAQFADGMKWSNYGEWHLDHILPLSLHDLGVAENWKNAFSVRNYQPMWKDVNMSWSNSPGKVTK